MIDLARIVAACFALLAALHVYWAVGGRWGAAAAIPERDGAPVFRPGLGRTLVVAGLLGLAALLVLARSGCGPALGLPRWMVSLGVRIVAILLLGRAIGDFRYIGFFKRVRGTTFATLDTRLYSPIALLLGAATARVAWGRS